MFSTVGWLHRTDLSNSPKYQLSKKIQSLTYFKTIYPQIGHQIALLPVILKVRSCDQAPVRQAFK